MNELEYLPVSTLRICIDQKEDEKMSGRVYCPLFSESILFENQCELILKADQMFEQIGYPQAFQEKRSFSFAEQSIYDPAPERYLSDTELLKKTGQLTTVHVIVECRRRAGWQGRYIDAMGEIHSFISEMELLRYMNEEQRSNL